MVDSSAFRKSGRTDLLEVIIYVAAAFTLLIVLYPLWFVIIASLSDPIEVIKGRVLIWPKHPNLEAYKMVFENRKILLGYRNSICYMVLGTSINMILTVMTAYPLSRGDLPGSSKIMMFVTFTMLFSGGIIPTYLLVRQLGLYDTVFALIMPTAVVTYNLIVMRTYFMTSIPKEMHESAYMDGCNNIRVLLQIILPLSKPILAVITLFYAVGHWNMYFNALIYLRDSQKYPLQLILREILLNSQLMNMEMDTLGMKDRVMISETIKYAVIIVASVPMLILYPFIQKYFVKGVMIGAIKG